MVALLPTSKTGRPTASWWQWVGSMTWQQQCTWVALHIGGNAPKIKLQQSHWRQNTLVKISKIWHSQTQHSQRQVTLPEFPNSALSNLEITLAAKHLVENIKNLALTNLAFTVASHIAGITKSGNAKFSQLPWRQNILLKISQSGMDKPSIHSGKSLCPNSLIRHC
jgi:hypothetical protein